MKRTEPLSNWSLVLKDYLETASDASRRTRFITIIMLVASVLVLVSVLDSADYGWITLRLNALRHKTSRYTVRKFPLLCECDVQVKIEQGRLCESLKYEEGPKDLLWKITDINNQLKLSNIFFTYPTTQPESRRVELKEAKDKLCTEENEKLKSFYETMQRAAAEVKYTVRVPFFWIAFDINDIGILGGFSLWIILILLRLSLRQQIISLRIGFKAAFACDQEIDFYQILATRQVFVFPYVSDPKQSAKVSFGWIEIWWRQSVFHKLYHRLRIAMLSRIRKARNHLLITLKILQPSEVHSSEQEMAASTSNVGDKDEWQANRNISLRFVPKLLSLVPFFIYLYQYTFDVITSNYGFELSTKRTLVLLVLGAFFLLNLLILGIWCITKWNELDRLWDYYYQHIKMEVKPGKIELLRGKYFYGATEVKQ